MAALQSSLGHLRSSGPGLLFGPIVPSYVINARQAMVVARELRYPDKWQSEGQG